MFITTFYSYKGGVGRTMALTNVAAVLSERGRRVLIVDFDLEAPGIPSYEPFEAARGKPGLVDYIHRYLETNEAPAATEYITRCDIAEDRPVWIMPAGDNTSASYAQLFSTIDWHYLYEERQGYLLFEDLKNQWAQFEGAGFDYVLVDSRTGNTDTSGICTRQLPGLVVILFAPTRQNICGLRPIVDLIRSEPDRGGHVIDIIFCPSNLPDSFDEDGILGRALVTAREQLGFGDPAGLEPPVVPISHSSSMALLDLPVITLAREKSKLAKQYRELAEAVTSVNPEDRDGAIAALRRLPRIFEAAREENRSQVSNEIQARAAQIVRGHPSDPVLAMLAAEIFFEAQAYEEAERYLTTAIENGPVDARPHLLRAVTRINLDLKPGALEDLKSVLMSPHASTFESGPAARLLRSVSGEAETIARQIFDEPTTAPRVKIDLAPYLMTSRENLGHVAEVLIAELSVPEISDDLSKDIINVVSIALIGARRYEEALTFIERVLAKDPEQLASRFNALVARWGLAQMPDDEEVASLFDRFEGITTTDPNNRQCAALIAALSGATDSAFAQIKLARERAKGRSIFSCWTYLYRTAPQFREDLEQMEQALAKGAKLMPPFLEA